jgi:hypothetical protein
MITTLIRLIATLVACCVITGCATVNTMAFDKQTKAIDTKDKSIVLMTVVVSRPDKSRFEPVPYVVHIEKPDAQSKEDRQNFKIDKETDATQANGQEGTCCALRSSPENTSSSTCSAWRARFQSTACSACRSSPT